MSAPSPKSNDRQSIQHEVSDQANTANTHATQVDGTKSPEQAAKNDDMPKKTMKRIQPEKIAEVGEWKAEKEGEEADEEDNAELSTEDSTSA